MRADAMGNLLLAGCHTPAAQSCRLVAGSAGEETQSTPQVAKWQHCSHGVANGAALLTWSSHMATLLARSSQVKHCGSCHFGAHLCWAQKAGYLSEAHDITEKYGHTWVGLRLHWAPCPEGSRHL